MPAPSAGRVAGGTVRPSIPSQAPRSRPTMSPSSSFPALGAGGGGRLQLPVQRAAGGDQGCSPHPGDGCWVLGHSVGLGAEGGRRSTCPLFALTPPALALPAKCRERALGGFTPPPWLSKHSTSGTLAAGVAPATSHPPRNPYKSPRLQLAKGPEPRSEGGRDGRQLQRGADGGGTSEVHGLPPPALHPPPAQVPPGRGGGGGRPRGGHRRLPPPGAAHHRDARRNGLANDHPWSGRRRDPPTPLHEQEGEDGDVRRAGRAQRHRRGGVRLQQAAGRLQVLAAPRLLRHPRGQGQHAGAGRRHRDLPASAG